MPDILLETACLPLYSESEAQGRFVPERNSLNMWNASGRPRHEDEIGIPIPIEFRNHHPDFFPGQLVSFMLKLPNGTVMSAKQCQQGGKALMSNPNKSLGRWLLRNVLKIPVYTVVTYEHLRQRGIDSVFIEKVQGDSGIYYKISPAPLNAYDKYIRGAGIRALRPTSPASSPVVSPPPVPSVPDSNTVSASSRKNNGLTKGRIINHPAFGKGRVVCMKGRDTVKIKFSDQTREIKLDWLDKHGLL